MNTDDIFFEISRLVELTVNSSGAFITVRSVRYNGKRWFVAFSEPPLTEEDQWQWQLCEDSAADDWAPLDIWVSMPAAFNPLDLKDAVARKIIDAGLAWELLPELDAPEYTGETFFE